MTVFVRRVPAVVYQGFVFSAFIALLLGVSSGAQVTGPTGLQVTRSVNMVSGDTWPNGDPFLQRQNEPSVAASTRNPQHLLGGANDYRTVDLPGLPTGPETGDAWLGLFKSFDGGERWQSTLLPGYPQDTSAAGMASPLKGFQAGADPVVRPGTNGLLYYAGLAFNRGENQPSAVFMSRFIDNNNKENGDPIKYLGTTIIDKSTGADFIDKPWMAVDVPRQGAKTCRIVVSEPPPAPAPGVRWGRYSGWKQNEADKKKNGKVPAKPKNTSTLVAQSIPAGRIYVAYSRITTTGTDIASRIMFSQSDDCGVTWSKPVQLSNPADKVNQGATVAIDPKTGTVHVAWRQFGLTATATDSVMVARMALPGKPFDPATRVHKFNAKRPNDRLRKMIAEHQSGDADEASAIQPFDQGTAEDKFRTNAYPTMAIDDESRVYLAWTQRGFGQARSSAVDGDARVVVATSRPGTGWSAPRAVDTGAAGIDTPGHQLMPSIAFAAGKLVIVYYDLREDVSQVFGPWVSERDALSTVGADGKRRRHTIDIRTAHALKGDAPVFGASQKVSQYLMGSRPGSRQVEQLQYNTPALPLFKLGTVPFMGDYIDLAPAPAFVQDAKGTWGFNTAPAAAPVFHVVWTDNRDVRPPADGNWANYTPPAFAVTSSKFDPTQPTPQCQAGQTGMRNQNIYSARLTWGLVAGSPGNSKPLSATLPRSFVVFAQNTSTAVKSFRFTIASQPVGGAASFLQSGPLVTLDVSVPAKSMVTRSVFITSTDPKAQVPVDIQEIAAPSLPVISGGLASRVVLNPDISNPDISNPDISNPDISNPDISNAEVYNPDISNPDISNPDISNPDISNPDISNPDISNVVVANPDISNPDISNPDISNPDISNPDISNPDISNPDISNGALTDVTWTIVNTGNTTTSYNVNLFMANAAAKLGGVKTQLVVHKTYSTPIASACVIKQQTQTVLVANVPNPTFYAPGTNPTFNPSDPSVTNTTLWLEPGGEGKITLRIIDPNPRDAITINPARDVTPVVTAEPKNTEDLATPVIPPPSTAPPTMPDVLLAFTGQPTNTAVNGPIAPITVHAQVGVADGAGIQVTLAIAINPAGGHLSGTTTLLTDQFGNATFTGLSIEKAGTGYRLSASASASGAVPDLSVPFDIGAVAPPPPPAAWSAVGNGTVTLLDNGLVGGTPRMTYDNPGVFNGAWTVSHVATATGPVRLDWEWTGFHSYCAASARIEAFVNHLGVDTPTGPFVNVNGGCTNANNPSSGFAFAGSTVLTVQAGDTYGFRLFGGHGDGTFAMNGTFAAVVNGATSADPFVVTNASDGGPGSLRAALIAANALVDTNTITFAIPGAWMHTIAPMTPLPLVSNPVIIDGLSQPGSASMAPMINIDGRFLRNSDIGADDQAGTNIGKAPGFEVVSSDVTIRGLGINRFPGPAVYLANGTNNVRVEDSAIGAGAAGVMTWPANNVGVWANYSSNHAIARNVISSSEGAGILLIGGSGTTITGNRIGTTVDGLGAWPNFDNGITLYDGTSGTVIDGNLISGNGQFGAANGHGIDLQQSGGLAEVTNTVITNNTIGLDINGNLLVRGATNFALGFGPVERGNAGSGIRLQRASGTVVGGPGAGNVISGNRFSGVLIEGTASGAAPRIIGNVIGTNAAGTAARANGGRGVNAQSAVVIGEPGAGRGNLISGNLADGVFAFGNALIENNLIGTDITGTLALGNGRLDDTGDPNDPGCCHTGVFAARLNNIVRGNVVSGNRIAGIRSGDSGVAWGDPPGVGGNLIEDNKVGTDITGLLPIPNGEGIGLYGDQSGTVVRRNQVAFNTGIGVRLVEGTVGATIGGGNPIDGNRIHNNGQGVVVGYNASAGDINNRIWSNLIYGNGGIAIDLGFDGGTANDGGDGDIGPNLRMNTPTVAAAENGATTSVKFALDSAAGAYLIQFFSGASCGAMDQFVTSANSGIGAVLTHDLGVLLPIGTFIMATATDAAGNTSELSNCVQVVAAPPPPSPFVVTSTADTPTLGTLRYALTEANLTVAADTITFAIPGGGAQTINLTAPLPAVTAPVTIDATTQAGYDGKPMVRLDGAATAARGIELQSPSTVKGLAITGFGADAGVLVMGGGANSVVEFNHIGTDRVGAAGMGNGLGVKLNYTNGVIVRENLISGNVFSGVQVTGGTANQIRQNGIGTGLNNTGALPNADNGISLFDGANGTIIDFNVISGNGAIGGSNGWGIDVQNGLADVVNTVITNNIIGLDQSGDLIARGGGSHTGGGGAIDYGQVKRGNAAGGVRIAGGAGTVVGAVGGGNTISGNTTHGIYLTAAAPGAAPTVQANRIGTDPSGNLRRANGGAGVLVEQANITIGGAVAGQGNVISGNLKEGVEISANGVAVQGNLIGTSATGMAAIGNGPKLDVPVGGSNRAGVVINGTANVLIGGVDPGARNVISGNRTGVMVFWSNNNVRIENNGIGTNKDSSGFLPNSPDGDGEGGIALYGGTNATITGNNISGNTGYGGGIFTGTGPVGAVVTENKITGNSGPGINVRGGDGINAEPLANMRILGNVIFGNTGIGIDLAGNGATPNDAGDTDTGSNLFQNTPALTAAENGATTTTVKFSIDSAVGVYTVEFFTGSACGRAEQMVLSTNVNNGNNVVDLLTLLPINTFVMATATDAAGNTSELSACVQVVVAPPAAVITSVTPANGMSGDGYLVLRGTNLPAGVGDTVAVISSGAGITNGNVHFGPSTPSAVWVRLQGAALGPATIQLKNNAGTTVSNAFAITVTATPGTPVITNIYDAGFSVVAGDVAAGSSIYVAADGIDTTGAVIHFAQGANSWDVAAGGAVSNAALGLAVQATVPAGAAAGAISVSIRQGASALSAPVAISVSAPPALITSVSPAAQVAAGFGQLFTIRGAGLPALSSADILFGQGGTEWPAQYAWSAGATEAIVRLPLGVLSPGAATVRMKNAAGTFYSAPFPITISNTPGAPVFVQMTDGCGPGPAITSVTAGQSVSVNAEGIDTSGLTFVWSGPGNATSTATSTTGANGYVTACGTVPALAAGVWTLQLKTAVGANTSALSNGIAITVAPPVAITSVSPASAAGGEGFVVARGTNLPAGLGDMVAVVTNGVNTANGFAMFSPSSPTAVWVRLPAGFPLGAATLQLKNNAGTQVSNAFPITVQAVPGTPVINAIRDNAENIIVAPVAAGSTILVGADGMDTTGAVVRFTQGANSWDVGGVATSNSTFGLALQVTVPAGAASGPINVSIRQGASAFSAVVVINVS